MSIQNILIIDDELETAKPLQLYLNKSYNCKLLSLERAFELEDTSLVPISKADVIITDFDMGENTAIDLLEYLYKNKLSPIIIIRSGNVNCKHIISKTIYENLVYLYLDKITSLKDINTILGGL